MKNQYQPLSNPTNIILIGFMGSGKSSIGKRLAKKLNYTYYDTDQFIEDKIGMTISHFIKENGEIAFRKLESNVLETFIGQEKIVISTGGGTILHPKNQECLRQLGTIVWLHAAIETLFERVQRNSRRPLLEVEHPRRTFHQLLSARIVIYQALSHIKIDTTNLSYESTLAAILEKLSS